MTETLPTKTSFGIALMRISNTGEPEVLVVNKRCTYAFLMFIFGKYNECEIARRFAKRRADESASGKISDDNIIELFNKMTLDEKLVIMTHDYLRMWYHFYLTERTDAHYYKHRAKFEQTFMQDGGRRLNDLLRKSKINGAEIWEIPKGRRDDAKETDLNCAIREFREETRIEKNKYKLHSDKTLQVTFISDNVKYVYKYYVAFATAEINTHVHVSNATTLSEIKEIRWMTLDDLRRVDIGKRIETIVGPVFRVLRRKKCEPL